MASDCLGTKFMIVQGFCRVAALCRLMGNVYLTKIANLDREEKGLYVANDIQILCDYIFGAEQCLCEYRCSAGGPEAAVGGDQDRI